MLVFMWLIMSLTLTSWQQYMLDDVKTYFDKTEYKNMSTTIVALAALESGWFKAETHNELQNVFSMNEFDLTKRDPRCEKKPIYCLRKYKTYKDGYEDALNYFRRNNYPTNRIGFLKRLDGIGGKKYAKDKKHVKKVKDVEWLICNKYLKGNFKSIP